MRILFLTLLIGISVFSMAQNGGQYPENSSVKLEWVGTSVKVTNKQSCQSVIRVTYSQTEVDLTIPGNSSLIFMPPAAVATIKAKNTTNCHYTDFGWVELRLTAMPVKFVSFDFEPLGNKEVLVTFETAETSNINAYEILASQNGIDYTVVAVIPADQITPNKKYSLKLNLSKFK